MLLRHLLIHAQLAVRAPVGYTRNLSHNFSSDTPREPDRAQPLSRRSLLVRASGRFARSYRSLLPVRVAGHWVGNDDAVDQPAAAPHTVDSVEFVCSPIVVAFPGRLDRVQFQAGLEPRAGSVALVRSAEKRAVAD